MPSKQIGIFLLLLSSKNRVQKGNNIDLLFQGQSLNEILSGPYERNIFSFPSLIFQLLFILHVLSYPSNKCLFFSNAVIHIWFINSTDIEI